MTAPNRDLAAPPAPSRAMWVWTRPDPAPLVAWARAQRVGTMFVAVPPAPAAADVAWLDAVAAAARAAGVRVTGLGGDSGWLLDPDAAVAWLRSTLATGLVDGLHVDVEPWADEKAWKSAAPALTAAYLRLLRRMREATTAELEVDLAHWLHQVPTREGPALDRAVLQLADAVTVLSYRDRADGVDGVVEVGRRTLRTAEELGVPCRLAVETKDLGPGPVADKQTFHQEGRAVLDREAARVDAALGGVTAYAGLAVHHYDTWRALRP